LIDKTASVFNAAQYKGLKIESKWTRGQEECSDLIRWGRTLQCSKMKWLLLFCTIHF